MTRYNFDNAKFLITPNFSIYLHYKSFSVPVKHCVVNPIKKELEYTFFPVYISICSNFCLLKLLLILFQL